MPFYEYECSACKFYVEALQKISDPPLRKCPSCKKQTMKRLVSAPVFRLKGGGWYETDFKSDSEQKRNLAGREEAGESESKSDQASTDKPAESKADAKSESKTPEVKTSAKSSAKSSAKAPSKSPARPAKPASKSAKPAAPRAKSKPAAKKK